jgi:hypothetical protein
MQIVNLVTRGVYEEVVEPLVETCAAHNIPLDVTVVDPGETWQHNCAMKAQHVLDKLNEYRAPIVWLDADAEVLKYPVLFDEFAEANDHDFAGYSNAWDKNLISSVLWFNYTPTAISLAEKWAKLCAQDPTRWDQDSLWLAMRQMPGLRWRPLPRSYNHIMPRGEKVDHSKLDCHIIQRQASRVHKKQMGDAGTIGRSNR